ncbi:16S rRNA (adenine(1518)-N(6)/adenine(1519)-N(6))-dimethyltransferase, partial [Francisella tularensis subsp. holarctica]|uniref:rRNA adenine N-6-methyltransferase family protein n=1 Tax=Francisella tularensis TaxID=263 RepID=UPI002381C890
QYKTKAKKSRGQNFLQDENIIRKIVQLANITKHDIVVEIGPGLGALTIYLLSSSNNVSVVEFDASVIDTLIANSQKYGTPHKYNQDLLK